MPADFGNTTQWVNYNDAISMGIPVSSPTGTVGFTTGAGGAVTQLTSKATTVVLNTPTGAITLNNASLATVTAVSFTLTDSAIAATSTVVVNHASAGTAGSYFVSANSIAAGSCKITVYNLTGGTLSEAIVLNFTVLAGAIS